MFLLFVDEEWCQNPAEIHFHSLTSFFITAVCLIRINKPLQVCLCKAADISDVLYYNSSCRRSLYFWIFIVSALLNALFLLDRMFVTFHVKFVKISYFEQLVHLFFFITLCSSLYFLVFLVGCAFCWETARACFSEMDVIKK